MQLGKFHLNSKSSAILCQSADDFGTWKNDKLKIQIFVFQDEQSETAGDDEDVEESVDLQEETQCQEEEDFQEESQSILGNNTTFTFKSSTPAATPSQSPCTSSAVNDNKRKLAGIVPPKQKRMKAEDELLSLAVKRFKEVSSKKAEQPKVEKVETEDEIYAKYLAVQIGKIKHEQTKEYIKMKVQQLIFEAQFGQSFNQAVTSMPPLPSIVPRPQNSHNEQYIFHSTQNDYNTL